MGELSLALAEGRYDAGDRRHGTMRHFDKNGRPLLMKGVQMEAKDGTKYLMKDDAIWKQLSTKGTLHPNR